MLRRLPQQTVPALQGKALSSVPGSPGHTFEAPLKDVQLNVQPHGHRQLVDVKLATTLPAC